MKGKNVKKGVFVLIILIVYVFSSVFAGFPLGFGKIMERNMAKRYCSAVYPQARLGKTVFNPVANGYETAVDLEDETIHIGVNLTEETVTDYHRQESFLNDNGVKKIRNRLGRTYERFISVSVVWKYDNPTIPIASLRLDYADYGSSSLPSEEQIKELLAPIVLDCIDQIEAILPLESVVVKYYHPNFNPDEVGMTWRSMEISLDNDEPRTKELFDAIELVGD